MPCPDHLLMAAVLGCLPAAGLAQQQLVEVALPIERPLIRSLTAPPRELVELCARLQAGRVFNWAFEAESPVGFNTHFHLDGAVAYPESLSAVTAARGRLAPGESQDYCWLWSNPGSVPVNIRVRITP